MFEVIFWKYIEKTGEWVIRRKNLKCETQEEAEEEARKLSIKGRKANLETDKEIITFRDGWEYKRKEKRVAPIGGDNYEVEAEVVENGKTYQYRLYVGSPEIKRLGGRYVVWCDDGRIKFCRNWMIRDKVYSKMLKGVKT